MAGIMTSHTGDSQFRDSLNWTAVQYVLGELPDGERFAFEERLTSDTVACEAVAEAARWALALQFAVADFATTAVPAIASPCVRSAEAAPRGSWLALAGATTAAAGLLAAMSLGPDVPRHDQFAWVDRSASELVSLWRTGSAATEIEGDEADVEVAEANHDVAVPHWLFAAVSLEQGKPVGNSTEEWQEN